MINKVHSIATKPWGQEEWLELNDNYCMKILTLLKGERLSLQYHKNKIETSFVLRGKIQLDYYPPYDDKPDFCDGQHEELYPGDFWTCKPNTIHRITALEYSVIVECSSIQVEDVVRLNDDYGREDPARKEDS